MFFSKTADDDSTRISRMDDSRFSMKTRLRLRTEYRTWVDVSIGCRVFGYLFSYLFSFK